MKKKKLIFIIILLILVIIMSFVCLLLGTFKIPFLEVIKAIFNQSDDINNRVILNIRIPRVLASIICGAGLSVAGLIMQTTLSNEMATPSTLGVSSSCVLGANVSIIIFAGGFLSTGNNINNYINNSREEISSNTKLAGIFVGWKSASSWNSAGLTD